MASFEKKKRVKYDFFKKGNMSLNEQMWYGQPLSLSLSHIHFHPIILKGDMSTNEVWATSPTLFYPNVISKFHF